MSEPQVILFGLILLRMIAFIVSSAVLGSQNVGAKVKLLLSIILSVLIFPTVKVAPADLAAMPDNLIILAARELMIGVTLGFLTRLFFFTVAMTGELVSISIGLGAAQMFNPMMGSNSNTLEQFYNTLATLIFFAINGHHLLITGIAQSYELIPLAQMKLSLGPYAEIATFAQEMMLMGIKMSAPILAAILVTNMAMGVLGKAVPQINVLVTSMPVTLMIGFVLMFLCIPLIVVEMNGVVDITHTKMMMVMKALAF
jgi:flagellar biosynthetic protein FliR